MTEDDRSGVAPAYGWYGDDFTGATDTLATIARRGRRAFLFLATPDERRLADVGSLDAIGIAGAARAMKPTEMAAELIAIGRFFRQIGVRILHYKCCSTFDSGQQVGNLATAIATLRCYVEHHAAAVVGGQPSLGRYCAFSNLFAWGEGAAHRLDRHPIMSRHPATPMNEADLVRHLQNLGAGKIVSVHWPTLETGSEFNLDELAGQADALLFDALTQSHLSKIGMILREAATDKSLLVVGASSVAEAVFSEHPPITLQRSEASQTAGPVLAFAGSLSPLTRRQIMAAKSYERITVDPDQLVLGGDYRDRIIAQAAALLADGRNVLLSTVDSPAPSGADEALAERSAALIENVLERCPVRRLAVAGGDTSSRITQSLGLWGLAYSSQIAEGVTLCRSRSDHLDRDGMLLMLKGGQMGDDALFERFLTVE